MLKKKAIVSFAKDGRERYTESIIRIAKTAIATNFYGDIFLYIIPPFTNDIQEGKYIFNDLGNFVQVFTRYPTSLKYGICALPSDVPYQFKTFAIQEVIEQGYEQVLWMDSTAFVCRDLVGAFEFLDAVRLIMPDNPGCPEATWTSDDCLEKVGCSIERARQFFEIMACVMMFDFTYDQANTIFNEYLLYSLDGVSFQGVSGSTRPDFKAHRHDQSVISAILDKYAIPHIPYGFLAYPFTGWDSFNPYIMNWGTGAVPHEVQRHLIDPIKIKILGD